MKQLIDAIRKSLNKENWFSALFMGLAIPDICGEIEDSAHGGNRGHGERARQWLNQYLEREYKYISIDAIWELRNSFFHTSTHIDDKLSNKLGDSEEAELLLVTKNESLFHDTYVRIGTNKFHVHFWIDVFCEDIYKALETLVEDVEDDEEIQKEIDNLFYIEKNPRYKELVFGDANIDWGDNFVTGLFINRPDEEESNLIKFQKELWNRRR